MYNYNKSVLSPYDPTKLAVHSILPPEDDLILNCCKNFRKNVPFDYNLHFIDDENMVSSVDNDCGNNFYPRASTKNRQINVERNFFSRSCEKPKCIPSNDQHNCSIDEQHTSNIFLNPYNLWDMIVAALMSTNHTNDRDSMSNQYLQTTIHQLRTNSYPVLSSLQTMDTKRKVVRVSIAISQKITYRTNEGTKQLLRLDSWLIFRRPEQWMEFRRLWRSVIVYKCSQFFQLFNFYCLLVQYSLFFMENLVFLLLFFDDFEWEVKVHRHHLCRVTLPQATEAATYLSTLKTFTLA